MQVKSTVKLNMARIQELTAASVRALEKTAEALHTEVVQAQVFPRDTGHLQNEATFVDYSESSQGKVTLVSATPYARRLYYHPEYHFQKDENPNARGEWYEDWLPGGSEADFAAKAYKQFFKEESGV
nr:MAG TPA: Minor capsid protein [Caudoviricetes sp.]